ncbi:MAG: hypothetical protein WDA12_02960 [Bacilli bacterium]
MNKLYKTIDNLEHFTIDDKDESEDKMLLVDFILLDYNDMEEDIVIPYDSIFSFDTFYNKNVIRGFIYADLENVQLGNLTIEYLLKENLISGIQVFMSDGTVNEFNINWCSNFTRTIGNSYIVIFEGKEIK